MFADITPEQIEPYLYKAGKDGPVKPEQCAFERPGYVNYHHYQCDRQPDHTIAGHGVCAYHAYTLVRSLRVERGESVVGLKWKVNYDFGQEGGAITGGRGHMFIVADTFDEVVTTATKIIKAAYGYSAVRLRSIVLVDEPQPAAPPPGQLALF